MSNEHDNIHDFDFNLICEYFLNLERQGPGSPEATLKALGFTGPLSENSRVADLGCGTGGQTMILAQNTKAAITGIDLFPGFIDKFNQNAASLGLGQRVKGITGSMDQLPFGAEELDLIWSEGAIYNTGFREGLTNWRRHLKKGGYVAVTEASWFTSHRPKEIEDFWNESYPGIDTIPNKVSQLQESGYIPVASFILPENCWTTNFYEPQARIRESFLEKHHGNKSARAFVESEIREANLYGKYKEYYGYVFFIGMKY